MSRRSTIGRNPLDALGSSPAAPPAAAADPVPGAGLRPAHPLDVLIPATIRAEVEETAAPTPAVAAFEPPADDSAEAAELAVVASRGHAADPGVAEPTADAAAQVGAAVQDFAKYLVFEAGGEKLAIEVLRVREITGQSPVSRVPGAAAFVRGVTNLRGKVIPVVDLALRLGLPPRPSTPRTALVICEASLAGERLVVALLVDGVDDVAELPPEAILPPPSLGSTRVDVFSGVTRRAADLFLILDPDRILDGTTQARMSSGA